VNYWCKNLLNRYGFTLLEVLVALVVIAIALAAAIKTSNQQIENSIYLRDRTLAHWVAMNVLTDIQVRKQWPSLGKQEGEALMGKQNWFWLLTVTATVDDELRRLEVKVYSQRQIQEPLAILVGFIGMPS
jgi:general secretion pathway protein I